MNELTRVNADVTQGLRFLVESRVDIFLYAPNNFASYKKPFYLTL